MWKVVLIVFVSWSSQADQGIKAVKSIERAQKALKEFGQPNCDTCGVAMAGKEDPSWRQCLNAVCPKGFGQYYDGIKKSATIALNGPEEQKLVDQVKKSFRTKIEAKLASYQRMLAFVKSGRTLSDQQAIQLGNLGLTFNRLDKFVFDRIKVDESASRKKLKELSDAEFKTSLNLVNMMIGEKFYYNSIALLDEDYDFYVQRHSTTTIQAHVNEALDSLTRALPKIEFTWGLPNNAIFATIRLGAVAKLKSGKFGRRELEDLRSDLISANFLVKLGKDPQLMAQLKSHNIKPTAILGESAEPTLSIRIEYMKAFLENRESNPQLGLTDNFNSILDTCMNSLRIAKQFYPTPGELTDFKKRVDKYKKDFATTLKPRMSIHSAAIFDKELADWKLSLPPTYGEYRSDLLRKLQDDYASTIKGMGIAQKINATKPELVTAVDIFASSKFKDDPQYAKNLKDICEENVPRPLRDKASLGADRLTLGALTVRDKHYGNGTCKHELGHLTSGLFMNGKMSQHSKEWYDQVRTCLKETKGHERNVEEDWADLTSAMAGGKYDNCAYTEDAESELTLKDDPNDTHSSHLYRHLHNLLISSGKIPAICKQALAEKGEVLTLKNCASVKQADR